MGIDTTRHRKEEFSQASEDMLVACTRTFEGSEIVDTPQIHRTQNFLHPFPFFNGVRRTQMSTAAFELESARLVELHKLHRAPLRWTVYAHSEPDRIDERLLKLGFAESENFDMLYMELAAMKDASYAPGVTVEQLTDLNLPEFIQTHILGWDCKEIEAQILRQELTQNYLLEKQKPVPEAIGFLARLNGEPAATSWVRRVGTFGFFVGGSTLRSLRHKGLYRGLLQARLAFVRDNGLATALMLGNIKTSAPICKKAGWKFGCTVRSFGISFDQSKYP